ncbi:glycoside hydrolase superfamily [Gongronella butleri]|nr:glycoside hydrolase superfamily [Gongronella butleri]
MEGKKYQTHTHLARSSNSSSHFSWDSYSFKVDGERVFIWGGEMHPFRLPSPNLWKDIFEKLKATGFNVVQPYFHWGFHSWNSDTVDMTGIRDIEAFLKMAQETGIYVSARPGPYINAETTAGGFALWTKPLNASSRTDDPEWTAAWKPYITKMAALLEKYQYPKGPVIMLQIDNEFLAAEDTNREYMTLLEQTYKDAGIYVPTFHNSPGDFYNPWTGGKGAPDLLGYDLYPLGFGCPVNYTDWTNFYNPPLTSITQYKADTPVFLPEYGGGAFDNWGGNGYEYCRLHTNENYNRVFYRWNLEWGMTMQSTYMTYGGTNWGHLRFPEDYTSYDYGAPITESRQLSNRTYEMKLLGYFFATAKDLLQTEKVNGTVSSSLVTDVVRVNPETKAEFHIVRHTDMTSLADTKFSMSIGNVSVPQEPNTFIRLNGRDSKILSANLDFLGQHLVYSTTDVLTWGTIDDTDYLVLHGLAGEQGEVVLRLPSDSKPKVKFFGGHSTKSTVSGSQLRLNYVVDGLFPIEITHAGKPLTILVADLKNAYHMWRLDTRNGPAFVFGSYLVRGESSTSGKTLTLRGDADATDTLEIFGSKKFKDVSWNNRHLKIKKSQYGSYKAKIEGPPAAVVPKLNGWTVGHEAPEATAEFDDSDWVVANKTKTFNSIQPPAGQNVLYADDYAFHVGHLWYRGHFEATGDETKLNITVQGGSYSIYSAWLNGDYIGTFQSSGSAKPNVLDLPSDALVVGNNVVSILVDAMGSDESGWPSDVFKAYRGLHAANLLTKSGLSKTKITWKLQGNLGGTDIVDTHRGTFNTGGKFGERKGWHLPGFPATRANNFTTGVSLPHDFGKAGIAWYFTNFTLNFPKNTDNPLVVSFDKPAADEHYRAEFFLNGWNFGKLVTDLGPQFDFPVPPGILNTNGVNHLAIAVHGLNKDANTFADVKLKVLASYTYGGPAWVQTEAPDFDEKVYGLSASF